MRVRLKTSFGLLSDRFGVRALTPCCSLLWALTRAPGASEWRGAPGPLPPLSPFHPAATHPFQVWCPRGSSFPLQLPEGEVVQPGGTLDSGAMKTRCWAWSCSTPAASVALQRKHSLPSSCLELQHHCCFCSSSKKNLSSIVAWSCNTPAAS